MARVCYVIIAHNEPANLFGLIGSLWNPDDAFLIWIDARSDQRFVELASAVVQFGDNVHVHTGSVMVWGGFSIVATTLTAYSRLRAQVGQFSHVVLCSGTHIPLLHPDSIFERIRDLAGWVDTVEVKIPEGGLGRLDSITTQAWWCDMLKRIRYRYVEVPAVGMLPAGDREAWNEPVFLEGSQWHVLRSDLVDFIVEHAGRVREVFHDVVVADEHAFQWIIAQWPGRESVRRSKFVSMEWAGVSPRRVNLAEAAEAAAAGKFLFLRKAASNCTIDMWGEWARVTLSNHGGARRLQEIAAGLSWNCHSVHHGSAVGRLSALDQLLQSFIEAVSRSVGKKLVHKYVGERRSLLATTLNLGGRGPVSLTCAVEPGVGIAIIPALARPPPTATADSMRLWPGMADFPGLVNLPIGGRVYWMLTEAGGAADIAAIITEIFEEHSHAWSRHTHDRSSPMTDRRVNNRTWIAETVKGRTFADVGGLWGTVNERVSAAILAGASEASMLDIVPLGHSLWRDFEARCQSLQVSGYKCVCADIMSPDLKQRVGAFDVVHCSGLIYHVPDLVAFVRKLMSITTRHLIIQSMVVAERIENELGLLDLRGGQCAFVPLLNESQRKIVAKYLEQVGLLNIPNLTGPPVKSWFHNGVWNYAPWSWLITPEFLHGLVETCGLSVIDAGFVWENKAYSVFCAVSP